MRHNRDDFGFDEFDPQARGPRPGHHGPGDFGRGGFGPGPYGRGDFGPDTRDGDDDPRGPHRGHRHGPGGPFGGPFGGPRGFGARRRRGDVGVALLLVLAADGPRNGYQMIQALQERSQGGWNPSPGSVYPALAQLEDRGLVSSQAVEGQTGHSYELTDAGRQLVAERGDKPAPWESPDGSDDERAKLLDTVRSTLHAARQLARDGDSAQITKATELFGELRRELYRILAGDSK